MAQISIPSRTPQQREQPKEDALDKLLKGLKIAKVGFGIAADVSSLRTSGQRRELATAEEARAETTHQANIAKTFRPMTDQEAGKVDPDLTVMEDGQEVDMMLRQRPTQQSYTKTVETADGIFAFDPEKPEQKIKLGDPKNAAKAKKYSKIVTTSDGIFAFNEEDPTDKIKIGEVAQKPGAMPISTDPLERKVSKMSAETKKRYDSEVMGLQAAKDMWQALVVEDTNTFSAIGDNNFTMASRMWGEAIGRLQSGAAISEVEEARFLKMAPTAFDSSETQKKKLIKAMTEMSSRISNAGIEPEEALARRAKVEAGIRERLAQAAQTPAQAPAQAPAFGVNPNQKPDTRPQRVFQNGTWFVLDGSGNYVAE